MCKNSEGVEIENKFLTDEATLTQLINLYNNNIFSMHVEVVERDERVNTYCDTKKNFQLYRRGMEYRTREKNEEKTKTDLKTPQDLDKPRIGPEDDGLMYRGEFSAIAKHEKTELSLKCFNDSSAAPYIKDLANKELTEWVKGQFKRVKVTFAPSGNLDSKIEIALERGHFYSANGKLKSDEQFFIEFETKDGNIEALLATIEKFKAIYGESIKLSTHTKGEMGLEWLASAGGIPQDLISNFHKAQTDRRKFYTKRRADQEASHSQQLNLNLAFA